MQDERTCHSFQPTQARESLVIARLRDVGGWGVGGRCVRGVSPRLHNRPEIWKLSLRLETKRHRNGRSSSGLGNGGRKLGSSPPVARVGPTTWGDVRRMPIVASGTMFSRAFGLRSCQWRSQETPNHSARPLPGSPTMPWILHVNRPLGRAGRGTSPCVVSLHARSYFV